MYIQKQIHTSLSINISIGAYGLFLWVTVSSQYSSGGQTSLVRGFKPLSFSLSLSLSLSLSPLCFYTVNLCIFLCIYIFMCI